MTAGDRTVDAGTPMGATVEAAGVAFRTWAPHAHAVFVVAGARLERQPDLAFRPEATDALRPLGDGTWGGFVPGVGDGAPYMFFIEGDAGAGWKRDPYARDLTLIPAFPDCHCVVRQPDLYPWHDDGWRSPAFDDLIIYQLHVGTWWAQDAAGNDVRATRGGTFLDVVAKLPHLRALGITAIQLLPIQEFETAFSLGYNGVDYFAPEGRYAVAPEELDWRVLGINATLTALGKPPLTAADLTAPSHQLKCLVDLCHLHGIAVILDLVYNHAGGGFDPHSLWFYDFQTDGNKNNSLYFTDADWAGGQVFAYWNDWVAQFLIDNAVFFLKEYRSDGIRYDEVRVIENNGGAAFLHDLTSTVRYVRPSAIQIAEYWNPDRLNAVRPAPAGLGFDAELGDGLRDALRGLLAQLAGGASASIDLSAVAGALPVPGGYDGGWRLNHCLENQDKVYVDHGDAARVAELADSNDPRSWYARSRSRAVTTLLLTAPGIPTLFMGQEFLEDKKWSDDRGKDLQIWWAGLSVADPTMRDFLQFFTDLIRLRRRMPALRSGKARVSCADGFGRVLVLHRWIEWAGQDVVVVASFDERPKEAYTVGLPSAGAWEEVFNSDVYDHLPNPAAVGNAGRVQAWPAPRDGFEASVTLRLPANGAIVLAKAP